MACLLGGCGNIHEQYNEIDHIAQLAVQAWDKRNGAKGKREPRTKPRDVRIAVGLDVTRQVLSAGPQHCGRSCTPELTLAMSSRLPGSACSEHRRRTKEAAAAACVDHGLTAGGAGKVQAGEEFSLPDFLLMESPRLAEMHWESGAQGFLGPVRRSATLFAAVVTLLKLRWLIRLHCALVSFAGPHCSLQRILSGLLVDICSVHAFPHPPAELYELFVQTLKTRLMQRWPLFLSFVATHEPGRLDGSGSQFAPFPSGQNSVDITNAADLWQLIDDLFIAYLVQLDPSTFPAGEVMQELDYFGLVRPIVQARFEGLLAWQAAKDLPGSQPRHMRQAQYDAHCFALLLEVPTLREDDWHYEAEEVLELVRTVVTHPKTFNPGLRSRVEWVMKGGSQCSTELDDIDEEQFSALLSYTDVVRDRGRLGPLKLSTLRDTTVPIMVGRESRFKRASPRLQPIF